MAADSASARLKSNMKKLLINVLLIFIIYLLAKQNSAYVLYLPVIINLFLLVSFGRSLFSDRSYIERIAMLKDPNLPPEGQRYCRKLTGIWCLFFVFNLICSAWTVYYADRDVWFLYNCVISYILIGVIFSVEYLYRRRFIKRINSQLVITPILILLSLSGRVSAEDILSEAVKSAECNEACISVISEKFSKFKNIQADFEQKKSIAGLKREIVSSGKFIYSEKSGIYWAILTPVKSIFIVTKNGINKRAEGEAGRTLEASGDAFVSGFSKVFLGLFNGDFKLMQKVFTVRYLPDYKGRWLIGLQARNAEAAKYIDKMALIGSEFLESIHLQESEGDRSQISFKNNKSLPDGLSASDEALYKLDE